MEKQQREQETVEVAERMHRLGIPLYVGSQVTVCPEHDYNFKGIVLEILEGGNRIKAEGKMIKGDSADPSFVEHSGIYSVGDIEIIDGRHVLQTLQGHRGSHPKTGIVVKVGTESQLKGKDEVDTLWMALKFMSSQARLSHEKLVASHIRVIVGAIKELKILGCYSEIADLSTVLLQSAKETVENVQVEDEMSSFWTKDIGLRLQLSRMGYSELAMVMNDHGLEKFPMVRDELINAKNVQFAKEVVSVFQNFGVKVTEHKIIPTKGVVTVEVRFDMNLQSEADRILMEAALKRAGMDFYGGESHEEPYRVYRASSGKKTRPANIHADIMSILKDANVEVDQVTTYDFIGIDYHNTHCSPSDGLLEKVKNAMIGQGYRVGETACESTFDIVWEGDIK